APGRLLDRGPHDVVRGTGHDRALDDDHVIAARAAERRTHVVRGLADVAEVDALAVEGGADGDEGHLTRVDRRRQILGRPQPCLEPLLVNWRLAAVDAVYLLAVDVDADDVVADLGETGARDQADVAGSDDADLHHASSASR